MDWSKYFTSADEPKKAKLSVPAKNLNVMRKSPKYANWERNVTKEYELAVNNSGTIENARKKFPFPSDERQKLFISIQNLIKLQRTPGMDAYLTQVKKEHDLVVGDDMPQVETVFPFPVSGGRSYKRNKRSTRKRSMRNKRSTQSTRK